MLRELARLSLLRENDGARELDPRERVSGRLVERLRGAGIGFGARIVAARRMREGSQRERARLLEALVRATEERGGGADRRLERRDRIVGSASIHRDEPALICD